MSSNTSWAGPRLLVPVTVDALIVTNNSNGTLFSVHPLSLKGEYSAFQNLGPQLFTGTKKPGAGIYLNWAMPDGMTNGTVNDEGRTTYPYLPNRWMIIRFSADAAIKRKAWIVKSDALQDHDRNDGTLRSQYLANENGEPKAMFIGESFDLDEGNWVENGSEGKLFLTAIGNSDPLFTAYAGNNALVFSFMDPLTDEAAHSMSYLVSGWYANPAYDILAKDGKLNGNGWKNENEWLELINRLQWSVGYSKLEGRNLDLDNAIEAGRKWLTSQGITPSGGLEGTLCAQTLCHGLVFDVQWPGSAVQPPSNVPTYDSSSKSAPYVSSGNAAIDCLSAFMQWQLNYNNPSQGGIKSDDDKEVEKFLEAFSHKMLPKTGGIVDWDELLKAIRETWYGRLPGGSVWVAQPVQKAGTLKPEDTSAVPPGLTPALARVIEALNLAQTTYDKEFRSLVTLQKQLYADWMKLNIYDNAFDPPVGVTQGQLIAAQTASLKAVTPLLNKLPKDKDKIKDDAKKLKDALALIKMELIEKPANDFYIPNDPVFLVNNTKRSFKRGEDIIFGKDDDYLFVRFSGQFITNIKVRPGNGIAIVNAGDICPEFVPGDDIPKEIPFLLGEACLLDTGFAQAIAAKASTHKFDGFVDTIKQQQTLIWNPDLDSAIDKQTVEAISGFNNGDPLVHVPSKIGVWKWVQPWTPLYMEWQIGYFPSADTDLRYWKFDGNDYQWTEKKYPEETAKSYVYKGRAILTPKEAMTLQARLREFIKDYKGPIEPYFVPLQDVLKGVGNWDVLSQTLTGFSLQLLQWNIEQFGYQPLDPAMAAAVGNGAHGMPMPIGDRESPFFPVRAGFANIQNIWIVDDFGQVYNLMPETGLRAEDIAATGVPPPPMHPIPAIGMRPGNYKIELGLPGYFQLPPRVVQGSRLNFDLRSTLDDKAISNQSPNTTPVCGWVLPNHLDKGLMVYNNAGVFLGELMLMGEAIAPHAQWAAAPFGGRSASGIDNKHLKGFVTGILGSSADAGNARSGKALMNFLKTIDETLWSVDPMGERNNQSLSILVGRPIAVVRASLSLELYGNASTNLSWTNTGKNNDGNIGAYKFPVQVGNIGLEEDGVMGYFINDDYSAFNSVHQGEVSAPANPPYIVNSFANLQFNAASPTFITLLLDPRGNIHCSSGILPVLKTELPDLYVGKVLDNMLIEFKTGPLLVDQKQWWLPLPAGAGQKWSWLQPQQVDKKLAWAEIADLVSANALPQLTDSPQTMVEGRLKLTGALGDQLLLLFFEAVIPGKSPYSVVTGQTVQLRWSSQAAVLTTLTIGTAQPVTVPANSDGYVYTVAKTAVLKLTVADGNSNIQSLSITINAI